VPILCLPLVEALSCNYGNQRWVKITFYFFTVNGLGPCQWASWHPTPA